MNWLVEMAETVKSFGETVSKLIDKLAGKGSDLQVTFKDLTLEVGMVKAKLNGSVVLDILYVTEKK